MRRKSRMPWSVSVFVAGMVPLMLAQSTNLRQGAMTLEQQGQSAEAETAWRAVLKTNPADAEAFAHLGFLEARQERYKEAVSHYRKALALNPAFPNLRLNLGLALFKAGELKEAIAVFKQLLEKEAPDSPEAQRLNILLGMAHYGLSEFSAATPYLKHAADRDAQNLELRLALAHSCLWSKQYPCVLAVYREILLLNAESAEADMLAGEAEDEMQNRGGAIQQFRAAVKADPKQPEVHFGLGYLLWTQHQYDEAISEFKTELANHPHHVQAQIYLGDAYMQKGNSEAALAVLEHVASLAPSMWFAHLDLGIVYSEAGRYPEALREFQEAAKLAPNEANVHWRLARLYKTMGKDAEAKAEFAKARNIHTAESQDLLQKMRPPARAPDPDESKRPPDQAPAQPGPDR
jgi:tetratricopeptide (TPR) repeat protein